MNLLPTLPTIPEAQIRTCIRQLQLPDPESISLPKSQGQMHSIIKLEFYDNDLFQSLSQRRINTRDNESPNSLILRVAARGRQHHKLENEAAVYIWLAQNTTIPVPQIVHHDSSVDNALEHEYMLMTHVLGEVGSVLYKTLDASQMDYILDQLADHFVQLSRYPFEHVGGLQIKSDGTIGPGPVIDEVQWFETDIAKYFPAGTLPSDINPSSPKGYASFTDLATTYMKCYIHAIRIDPCLRSLSYLQEENVSLLKHFIFTINQYPLSDKINNISYILAHRDLHFGQLLLDPQTCRITAVLDWEFAQITPFPLWKRSFLWHGDPDVPWSNEVSQERKKLRTRWKERIRLREAEDGGEGMRALEAQKWKYKEQRAVWDVDNYVRCIVEVTPRGVQANDARRWWDEVVKALRVLGICKAIA